MAKRLTMKMLSEEIDSLRQHMTRLEKQIEEKVANRLSSTFRKMRPSDGPMAVNESHRQRMIAEAAYYRAQARGFQGGSPEEDWKAAEAEIDRMLGKGTDSR